MLVQTVPFLTLKGQFVVTVSLSVLRPQEAVLFLKASLHMQRAIIGTLGGFSL